MSDRNRSAEPGKLAVPLRPTELFVINDAPEYDDDVKEWKVKGTPVRSIWGLESSGSGEYIGGGHRTNGVKRWRREAETNVSTLWMPSWWRKPDGDQSEEAIETPPPIEKNERAYVANIDGTLHILADFMARHLDIVLLEELVQFSGDTVDAARKLWSPSANDYTVDCTDIIRVSDKNKVGHNADVNGFGAVFGHRLANGTMEWILFELCCPGDEKGEC